MTEPEHREGDLSSSDIEGAPIERGTDPLSDRAATGTYRKQGQLVMGAVIGVVFAVLGVMDLTSGHVGRGLLALVVAALSAFIVARERSKPRRPTA